MNLFNEGDVFRVCGRTGKIQHDPVLRKVRSFFNNIVAWEDEKGQVYNLNLKQYIYEEVIDPTLFILKNKNQILRLEVIY